MIDYLPRVARGPPRLIEKMHARYEIPTAVASCPPGAIRKHPDPNVKSAVIAENKCMCCDYCFKLCPAMPIASPKGDEIAIYSGGKNYVRNHDPVQVIGGKT